MKFCLHHKHRVEKKAEEKKRQRIKDLSDTQHEQSSNKHASVLITFKIWQLTKSQYVSISQMAYIEVSMYFLNGTSAQEGYLVPFNV